MTVIHGHALVIQIIDRDDQGWRYLAAHDHVNNLRRHPLKPMIGR